jgi:hypothetical protein
MVLWHGDAGEQRMALTLERPDLYDSRPLAVELSCDPRQSDMGLVLSDHLNTGAMPELTLGESEMRALRDWLDDMLREHDEHKGVL